MNCDETRQHWDLYHDSEGDSEVHLRVNEHLQSCQCCARWFYQQSRLEDQLTAKLRGQPATAELWERIRESEGLATVAAGRRSWFPLASLLALAATLLFVVTPWMMNSSGEHDLARLTAARHEQILDGRQPVEFTSRSNREVEDYLHRHVDFPVRCPPRQDAGFVVSGGGVCRLGGSEAAYVVGTVDDRRISIYILPRASLAGFPPQQKALESGSRHHRREGKYSMIVGEIDHNVVVVVGDARPEHLARVLDAYGTYPHPDHG